MQPFAVASIWNTPVGRDARYVPAQLRASAVGVDPVTVVGTTARDPLVPALAADCATARTRRRLPASVDLPAGRTPQTLAVIGRGGRTVDALRTVIRASSTRAGRRVVVDVVA